MRQYRAKKEVRALGLLQDSIEITENALTYLKCNDYPERE